MAHRILMLCSILGGIMLAGNGDSMQPPGARETAAQMLAALAQRDWDKASALIETGDATAFRQRILGMLAVRVAQLDTTRTGGALIMGTSTPDLLHAHPAFRLARLRGQETVAGIVALPPRDLLAGAIEITQKRFYEQVPSGVSPRVSRKIERVEVLDDSTANVHYSVRVVGDGRHPQAKALLQVRKHAGRWYVVPGGDVVSQLILLEYLLKGAGSPV
jgi:hypothetical protein